MIRELREFCEDNNVSLPVPAVEEPAHPDLTFWFAGDPALVNEAQPCARLDTSGPFPERTIYIQRVVTDVRYLLAMWRHEVERGSLPDIEAAIELARQWLSGAEVVDLTDKRRPIY